MTIFSGSPVAQLQRAKEEKRGKKKECEGKLGESLWGELSVLKEKGSGDSERTPATRIRTRKLVLRTDGCLFIYIYSVIIFYFKSVYIFC